MSRYQHKNIGGVSLTFREIETIELVAAGLSNKEIAHEMGISYKTVIKFRQQAMDKTGRHCTAALTHFAIRNGLVVVDSYVRSSAIPVAWKKEEA